MIILQKNINFFITYVYAIGKNIMGFAPIYNLKSYHNRGYVSQGSLKNNNNSKPINPKINLKKEQLKKFEKILTMLKLERINYVFIKASKTNQNGVSVFNKAFLELLDKNYSTL